MRTIAPILGTMTEISGLRSEITKKALSLRYLTMFEEKDKELGRGNKEAALDIIRELVELAKKWKNER